MWQASAVSSLRKGAGGRRPKALKYIVCPKALKYIEEKTNESKEDEEKTRTHSSQCAERRRAWRLRWSRCIVKMRRTTSAWTCGPKLQQDNGRLQPGVPTGAVFSRPYIYIYTYNMRTKERRKTNERKASERTTKKSGFGWAAARDFEADIQSPGEEGLGISRPSSKIRAKRDSGSHTWWSLPRGNARRWTRTFPAGPCLSAAFPTWLPWDEVQIVHQALGYFPLSPKNEGASDEFLAEDGRGRGQGVHQHALPQAPRLYRGRRDRHVQVRPRRRQTAPLQLGRPVLFCFVLLLLFFLHTYTYVYIYIYIL